MKGSRLVAALGVVLAVACLAFGQGIASASERYLWQAANHERKAQGLPGLKWDDALATAARTHAAEMARQNTVGHTLPGEASLPSRATKAGARFGWLSENVIQATSVQLAHEQFMKSPNHKANILDSDMDTVGIGVAERGGQLFVVEDFSKAK